MTDCISFMSLNMILSLFLFFMSLIVPFLQIILVDKRCALQDIPEMMLKYSLFFNVGCLFIMGSTGQFLYGQEISSFIGWSWSPFQYELAFSELCLGILGLLSPLFNKEFWLATIIGSAVWLLGGSAVHLYYLFSQGNEAILNASFVIIWNIFIVLWLVAFFVAQALVWIKLHQAPPLKLAVESLDQ